MSIEQIPVDKVFISPGRTISEGEFGVLHSLTWATQELHTNKEYSKNTIHGERVLLGTLIVALISGLEAKSDWEQGVWAAGFRGIGLLGIDKVRFSKPVKPGDTLVAHTQIIEVRPSRKNPKRIILARKTEAYNQRGELVAELVSTALFESVSG
ncbi:MaoC family dehydratase, partial [Chloroflexota bacterium]